MTFLSALGHHATQICNTALKWESVVQDCCHSCKQSISESSCWVIILIRWHTGSGYVTIGTSNLSDTRGIGRRALQRQLAIEKRSSAAESLVLQHTLGIINVSLPGMYCSMNVVL